MPYTVVTGDDIGTGVRHALGADEDLLVLAGVNVVSTDANAIEVTGGFVDVTVAGMVFGNSRGILLPSSAQGQNSSVTVLPGGTVIGSNFGGVVVGSGGSTTIENAGYIGGNYGVVAYSTGTTGPQHTVSNSGEIRGGDAGIYFAGRDIVRIQNSGLIADGDHTTGGGSSGALGSVFGGVFVNGDNVSVNNSGQILGNKSNSYGVGIGGDNAVVVNSGAIQTASTDAERGAIRLATATGETGRIVNAQGGVIASGQTAIYTGDGNEVVQNTGAISGDVFTGSGSDLVSNSGHIDGDVNLGGGADILRSVGGEVTGVARGGGGDDVMSFDQLQVTVDGGSGSDIVRSYGSVTSEGRTETIILMGGADSFVVGDDEDNTIRGNSGDNELGGFSGNDDIRGNLGDDLLSGGSGLDTLQGGAGNDTLNGGAGEDVHFGGQGADVFVYNAASDSSSATGIDRIRDFESGIDHIDLSSIGGADWSFLGSGGFTGGGGSEVRFSVNGAGHAIVRIDIDGDGNEDARIIVNDTAALVEADFLF